MKIAVLGAGNGGLAIAAYISILGYHVSLYDRNNDKINQLKQLGGITLEGAIKGFGQINEFTTDISQAILDAKIVMITTVANVHQDLAIKIAPYAESNQIFILNPGRTCGALVFKQGLQNGGCNKRIYIAEAQSLVYACRIISPGRVNIIGVKDEVLLSALPSTDTQYVFDKIAPIYPCFKCADNIIRTSFENIGAIFHPCVMLLNAGSIERKSEFYFYRDMTDRVAAFIESFDQERLNIGKAYGVELLSVREWIKYAYKDTKGDTLKERMQNNPGYHDIISPTSIYIRQLTEDIPTGVLPLLELGKAAGVKVPLMESMVHIIESLLNIDLHSNGRNLKNLGLDGKTKDEIINYIINGK